MTSPGHECSITLVMTSPGTECSITLVMTSPGHECSITLVMTSPGHECSITLVMTSPGTECVRKRGDGADNVSTSGPGHFAAKKEEIAKNTTAKTSGYDQVGRYVSFFAFYLLFTWGLGLKSGAMESHAVHSHRAIYIF